VNFIGCEVCNKAVETAFKLTAAAREAAPYKKLSEDAIESILTGICNPEVEYGRWILKQDILETGNKLVLKEQSGQQKCKDECKSIQKSCENLFGDELDVEALSILLWKNKANIKTAQDQACKQWSTRCTKPVSVPSKYKRVDHPFTEMSEKDIEMEKVMASMKAQGLGGSMYDRESMEQMMANGEDPFGGGGMGDMYGGDPYGDASSFGYGDDSRETAADFEL
jgi:hypothetical protein